MRIKSQFCLVFILIFVGHNRVLAIDKDRLVIDLFAAVDHSLDLIQQGHGFRKVNNEEKGMVYFNRIEIDFPLEEASFFTMALTWNENEADNALFYYKTRNKNTTDWSDWILFEKDSHVQPQNSNSVSELIFLDKNVEEIDMVLEIFSSSCHISDPTLHLFNPVNTQQHEIEVNKDLPTHTPQSCGCPPPTIIPRSQWNPPFGCPAPNYTEVTHLIVHHSAGVNTSSNWAQVVLAIWDFHVNTNGWCDIGYNFLIDPNGSVYEGRGGGANVIGAHFCGFNNNTMGVCMLGNFDLVQPSPGAQQKLAQLLAWKCCDVAIDPLGEAIHPVSGLSLNNISGHQNGCATDCPGNFMYGLLPSVRQEVAAIVNDCAGTINDIFISNPVVSTEVALPGDTITASCLHNYTGTAQTTFFTLMGYFLSEDCDFDDTDLFLAADASNFSSNALQSQEDATLIIPDIISAGNYQMLFVADYSDAINETDESNNVICVPISIVETVGIPSVDISKEITIFPNPAQGQVTIVLQNLDELKVKVKVSNPAGQLVLEKFMDNSSNQLILDLKDLVTGFYFIEVSSNQKTYTMKLLMVND